MFVDFSPVTITILIFWYLIAIITVYGLLSHNVRNRSKLKAWIMAIVIVTCFFGLILHLTHD